MGFTERRLTGVTPRRSFIGGLLLVMALAAASAAGAATALAGLPGWSDAEVFLPASTNPLDGGGGRLILEDRTAHSLRFSVPPGTAFDQWYASIDADFGVTPEIAAFRATPSGAWVQLSVGSDLVGFERVGADRTIRTPPVNPCPDTEDAYLVEMLGVSPDERLWVECSDKIATIAADGATTTVNCIMCRHGSVRAASSSGNMWFVGDDANGSGWDLRLADPNGSVLGARHLQGPSPSEIVDTGSALFWVRPRAGASGTGVPDLIERLPVAGWSSAPVARFARGMSEHVGLRSSSAQLLLGSLTTPGDGSVWMLSGGYNRIIRVDASGSLTEFAVGLGDDKLAQLVAVSDRVWALAPKQHLYRAQSFGRGMPSLPVLNELIGVKDAGHGPTIGMMSSLAIASPGAVGGTRVRLHCVRRCRGADVVGTIRGAKVHVRSSIVLYDQALVETVASAPGYRSTRQVFQFRRVKHQHRVTSKILRIDGVSFDNLIACGC